jgi:GH15 family glucan-1,4-alpha-glucosidase
VPWSHAIGSVDWLCVPRFDAPSIFGSLLDREAGYFRLGPFGINHPTARVYEPGTNVLSTTWKTPSGWLLVRDALTMGPREGEDQITPHTRPPADHDTNHVLVRIVRCLEGTVEIELICEPAFDYGRSPGEWTQVDGDRHTADASGAGQTIRLRTDFALGIEGNRARARHILTAGDECYSALSWAEGLAAPADVSQATNISASTRIGAVMSVFPTAPQSRTQASPFQAAARTRHSRRSTPLASAQSRPPRSGWIT